MIFFGSDHHFGHRNIIKYENRPFNNVEEMDRVLINNWNAVVSEDDTVFHTGDFFLTRTDRQFEIINQLNGKIYLIRGNHDGETRTKLVDRLGFMDVYDEYEISDKLILSHRPKPTEELKEGQWNIHGHTHSQKDDDFQHICVSVEKWNYYPVSSVQILYKMREIMIETHNGKLNYEDYIDMMDAVSNSVRSDLK